MIMIGVALLLSMVLCMLIGVPYIDFLRKKTIGQYILELYNCFEGKQLFMGRDRAKETCGKAGLLLRYSN